MDTANQGERLPERDTAPEQARKGRRPADTFANRLILTIRLTGLTIREFAEMAGLDDGSVSNWTRGMRPRDLVDVCQAIAEAHDIDREWLLFGGALLPARGRPTERVRKVTGRYGKRPVRSAICPTSGRPAAGDATQRVRCHRVIDRSQPLAA